MANPFKAIANWYNRTYTFQIGLAGFLFVLQIGHLIWLFGQVLWFKLTGTPLFVVSPTFEKILVLFDYTEIPAIVTASIVFFREYKLHKKWKDLFFVFLINTQWLHILWITDEFVLDSLDGLATWLAWLALIAILIDYLEIPVIYVTIKKFLNALKEKKG